MRQLINILGFLLLTTKVFSQTMAVVKIENDLHKSYKKILSDRFDADTTDWDSLELHNKFFRDKLLKYTANYSATLTFKFDSLRKDNFKIISSDDKLLRIYSWDTWHGGTMLDFESVFQYKNKDKVYSKFYDDTTNDGEGYTPFYSQLFTLNANNKTYYLAVYNGIYSTKDASQSIKIFTIENKLLNNSVKLIKTQNGLTNSINVNFDFFSVAARPERPLRLIKYDNAKKIIYIPIVLENGKVTDKFILYQFTGQYFEKIKPQKSQQATMKHNNINKKLGYS